MDATIFVIIFVLWRLLKFINIFYHFLWLFPLIFWWNMTHALFWIVLFRLVFHAFVRASSKGIVDTAGIQCACVRTNVAIYVFPNIIFRTIIIVLFIGDSTGTRLFSQWAHIALLYVLYCWLYLRLGHLTVLAFLSSISKACTEPHSSTSIFM